MKKIISLVLGLFFCVLSVNAQLEKGTLLVGGSGNFSGGFGTNGGTYSLNLQPNVGIFVLPKFAIGAGIGVFSQYSNYGNYHYSSQGVYFSPFARYYFLKAERKFNIFAQTGFSVGSLWSKGFYVSSYRFIFSTNVKAGIAYFIRPQVALEASIAANFEPNVPFFLPNNQLSANLGFQIHLNKREKRAEIQP